VLGFAEELELLDELTDDELAPFGGRDAIESMMLKAATADHFIENTPTCGVPYWDTGAPKLHLLAQLRHFVSRFFGRSWDSGFFWPQVGHTFLAESLVRELRSGCYAGTGICRLRMRGGGCCGRVQPS
jgi:hypothetical protein